jgi:para-aminobenzoate synthetase component 1
LRIINGHKRRRNLFKTQGCGTDQWRHLQAENPAQTFVLENIDELNDLKNFLFENERSLIAGYFSYDLGLQLLGVKSRHATQYPLVVLHAYETWKEGQANQLEVSSKFEALNLVNSITRDEYAQSIECIHQYIRAGDFYQLNFTQQLRGKTKCDPLELFGHLSDRHPANFACFLEWGDMAIHSLSPELFLHFSHGILTTEPIKGTRPRAKSGDLDELMRKELLSSEKEQAELYMITDLLRNDLGKVCQVGSVDLEEIRGIHQLPKVWHTYSRINGRLSKDFSKIEALLSMLPGGSISGCPKKRAVEIIDQLENESRGIYTGSLGYFHPDGDFSFNIAIRTLIQGGEALSLGTGGGITIDSNWEDEWDELRAKASTFM